MAESLTLKDARALTKALEGERQKLDDSFAMISEYVLPHRGVWPASGDGHSALVDRGRKIINPASTLALERAAGGVTTGMTPEGQSWLGLRVRDDAIMEAGGVREHLGYREKLIYALLRMGGFYQAIHTCNMELFGFGNMLLFMDNDPRTLARFECCTMGTWAHALDANGQLDTVVRRIQWSAKQMEAKFGRNKLSKRTQALLQSSPYEKVDVVHVVRPRPDRDQTKMDARQMPYQSLLYEENIGEFGETGTCDVLRESGYQEMPYFFAPFSRVGSSDYGIGPGHNLIGHARQLNETERKKVVALQKMIDPPMLKPSGMTGRLNVSPGGETAASQTDPHGLRPLYEVNVPLQYVYQEINQIELRCAAVAKADLFYDMPNEMRPKDMTATEYMERKRERMQQIAPVLSLYEPLVLDKVIERAHNMLDRSGLFPPPPQALERAGQLDIEYTSIVAKSLRQSGAENARAYATEIANLAAMQMQAQQKPTALYKLDIPQVADEIASGYGVPARIVVDDEKFQERLAADAQREAAALQMQQRQMEVENAAKVGNVKTEGTIAEKMMEQTDV